MRTALALALFASIALAQAPEKIDVLTPKGRRDPFVDLRTPVEPPAPKAPQPPPRVPTPRSEDEDRVTTQAVPGGKEPHDRARIVTAFEGVRPEVVGLVYCLEEFKTRLTLGIGLLGRTTVVDTEVPLPKSNSYVTLRARGATEDRCYTEGQQVAEGLFIKRIERDQIAFQYEEETIWVQTH